MAKTEPNPSDDSQEVAEQQRRQDPNQESKMTNKRTAASKGSVAGQAAPATVSATTSALPAESQAKQPSQAHGRPDNGKTKSKPAGQAQQPAASNKRPQTARARANGAESSGAAATAAANPNQTKRAKLQQQQSAELGDKSKGAASSATSQEQLNVCAACLKPIKERYLLVALDQKWHEDCLKCACCDCRLGEVGSSLFTHSGKILCRRDFQRIFGQHGHCAVCKKSIPPYELVMRANENAYHMDCFACQSCQYRFCVGDEFHLNEQHKIICLPCYRDAAQQALLLGQPAGQERASAPETSAEAVVGATSHSNSNNNSSSNNNRISSSYTQLEIKLNEPQLPACESEEAADQQQAQQQQRISATTT